MPAISLWEFRQPHVIVSNSLIELIFQLLETAFQKAFAV